MSAERHKGQRTNHGSDHNRALYALHSHCATAEPGGPVPSEPANDVLQLTSTNGAYARQDQQAIIPTPTTAVNKSSTTRATSTTPRYSQRGRKRHQNANSVDKDNPGSANIATIQRKPTTISTQGTSGKNVYGNRRNRQRRIRRSNNR